MSTTQKKVCKNCYWFLDWGDDDQECEENPNPHPKPTTPESCCEKFEPLDRKVLYV